MPRAKSDTAHLTPFHQCVVDVLRHIPRGKVAAYGQIAELAGAPRAARQVVRILNACSEKLDLPWYRVINKQGRISLPKNGGYELQKSLLRKEGVKFTREDVIDLKKFGWRP
ncbi:MAG: MGMT family protein [Candidatus Zixiibacteriota bacterium]